MTDLTEELQAARRELDGAQARYERLEAYHNTMHQEVLREMEENRSALLFMLEDLEAGRVEIERAHHEWMGALDVVKDPIFLHDKEFRILRCNQAYQQLAGIPFHHIIGQPYFKIFPKAAAPLPSCLRAMEKMEDDEEEEMEIGDAFYRMRSFSVRDKQGIYLCSVHVLEDVSRQRKAEIAAMHAHRALAALSEVNRSLVRSESEDELLQSICGAIVKQRGYRMACVGYVRHDENKSVEIVASAGHDRGYLDAMQLTWANVAHGEGPSGRAIRSGVPQVCQDIAADPLYLPWRAAALECGYASSIALPLLDENNTVFGVLGVYAAETHAFIPREIYLLEEMAGDLAFGVHGLRIRHEHDQARSKIQQQVAQLKDSLEDTVRAIATIVEMRDPYTAGHQSRVAELAVAIAVQMGLPEEQTHAVYLAGVVHDLGKIRVPAEILSKPGKITQAEYDLMKGHPQTGYDILKGINFPWPIAQIVYQHHERIDGSGYPQGLKGADILLKARILTVADVVEAIFSHRPYRPGLGMEVALDEITKNRGKYYDHRVVDACLALFNEQGYKLKG